MARRLQSRAALRHQSSAALRHQLRTLHVLALMLARHDAAACVGRQLLHRALEQPELPPMLRAPGQPHQSRRVGQQARRVLCLASSHTAEAVRCRRGQAPPQPREQHRAKADLHARLRPPETSSPRLASSLQLLPPRLLAHEPPRPDAGRRPCFPSPACHPARRIPSRAALASVA